MEVQGIKSMIRLTADQISAKHNFITNYCTANTAADGSVVDPNSNVATKNVATLMAELNKDISIQVKRKLVYEYIVKLFGKNIADNYIQQLEKHEIYTHDETYIAPYCVAASLYPFFENGLQTFGGDSKAPKHLSSFNGGFINLVFALTSQFCGAVATVEYLMAFDHYARIDYGDNYLEEYPDIIKQELQQVIYALNQPASARGFQSVFWNISIFDRFYFDSLFSHFTFPDGDKPNWDTLNKLQKFFLHWFNEERTKALLTFPIVTVAMLHNNNSLLDTKYEELVTSEIARGNSFFIYTSDTVDSLSSCCRLRNNVADQINDFSYSLGAGGVMTGSVNVITLNINRFIQELFPKFSTYYNGDLSTQLQVLKEPLEKQIELIHQYQLGTLQFFKELQVKGMLPAYDAQFISFDKQYLTVGINGLVESAEYLRIEPNNNPLYITYISHILKVISDTNRRSSHKYDVKFNTEMVPAENLGVKFAKWDKQDGLEVGRSCYNSYFYPVENTHISVSDKFILHGKETTSYLDGGQALHLNLEEVPTQAQARWLLNQAVKTGCNYFCFNTKVTICNQCGYINKHTKKYCIACGSKDIDYATRVIGYLRRITNFSKERQAEEYIRHYH